jgi:hypothetical protein
MLKFPGDNSSKYPLLAPILYPNLRKDPNQLFRNLVLVKVIFKKAYNNISFTCFSSFSKQDYLGVVPSMVGLYQKQNIRMLEEQWDAFGE